METGCVTATGPAEATGSAAATTPIRGSSAWTASTGISTKSETIPSLCVQVNFRQTCIGSDTVQ